MLASEMCVGEADSLAATGPVVVSCVQQGSTLCGGVAGDQALLAYVVSISSFT